MNKKKVKCGQKGTKMRQEGAQKVPNWKKIIFQLGKYFFPTGKLNFPNWPFPAFQLDLRWKSNFVKFFCIGDYVGKVFLGVEYYEGGVYKKRRLSSRQPIFSINLKI